MIKLRCAVCNEGVFIDFESEKEVLDREGDQCFFKCPCCDKEYEIIERGGQLIPTKIERKRE